MRVEVFKPHRKYRLIKNYHYEALPLVYDAKAGDILAFRGKGIGGYAHFYKIKPDADGIYHTVIMQGTEAFKLLEEIQVDGNGV